MGRQPKIRASYGADATYLLRLIQAVEKDESQLPEWRGAVIGLLSQVVSHFNEATTRKLNNGDTPHA